MGRNRVEENTQVRVQAMLDPEVHPEVTAMAAEAAVPMGRLIADLLTLAVKSPDMTIKHALQTIRQNRLAEIRGKR